MQYVEWRGTWQSPMVRKQGGRGKRCKCHLLGGVANQGREWQKDKKEPSQNLQAPPPCTLDPGFAITRVPDGPTSWVFASAFDEGGGRSRGRKTKSVNSEKKKGICVEASEWSVLSILQNGTCAVLCLGLVSEPLTTALHHPQGQHCTVTWRKTKTAN